MEGFTLQGARPDYAPDLELEPVHLDVAVALDLAARGVRAEVTTTLRARAGGARTLALCAVGFEDVQVLDPDGGELRWRYDGRRIAITWAEGAAPGDTRRVSVAYRVADPVSGLQFSWPDEAYPARPRFVISDHETERARYWLPCVDVPSVRTAFDWHITVPAELTVVAGGLLVGEESNGDGTRTWHWRLEEPCPSYLACIAAGELVRSDDGHVDQRELVYWGVPPATPDELRRTFGRTGAMMRWMQERLGVPFPYPKYHQIAVPEIGGAMENITLVTWDDGAVLDERLARERSERVDAINVHEMAHAYFGDSVVIRHFEHAWLKESWAVYVESLWWEDQGGRERRDWDLDQNAQSYFEEVRERYARPIVTRTYDSSWRLFDMHTYPGGAWRIHMLRQAVGDQAFFAATRDYLESFAGKTAETDDFRRALEARSGKNLQRFFDQWIHAPGHPRLEARLTLEPERDRALLALEQKQVDRERGIGLFAFPLEVSWEDELGRHVTTLELERERHEAVLPVRGRLLRLELDPESRALFELELDPGQDLLEGSLSSPHLKPRLQAARTLAQKGERAGIAALERALAAEPFFGVRAAAADALGRFRTAAAIEPLARMLAAERDPRVQAALARAAGRMRDPRLRDALVAFLDRDETVWARRSAYTALGCQRDERDLERLMRGAAEPSPHELVRSGALLGLGELGSAAAFEELQERVPYGVEPEPARPAAVEALARAASLLGRDAERRAAEILVDLTRDPKPRVRMAAGRGLEKIGDRGAIPALEALRACQPHQDAPTIERWIATLRKGRDADRPDLRRELERLAERCRSLSERVDRLEAERDGT